MADKTVCVVTGANRGLGFQIAKQLVESSKLGTVVLYAASRSGEDIPLKPSNPASQVICVKLDQTKPDDIQALVQRVKKEQGQASIVIANAGVAEVDVTREIVKRTFDTNYHGALNLALGFIPIMRKGGRFVTVGAGATQSMKYSKRIETELFAQDLTIERLDKLLAEYESTAPDCSDEWPKGAGWMPAYATSKVGVSCFTRILARDHPDLVFLAACCGATATDMLTAAGGGLKRNAKTPAQGAAIIVNAATSEEAGKHSGSFWANHSVFSTKLGAPLNHWYGYGLHFDLDEDKKGEAKL